MALIRATCSDCGDVELRSPGLQLRVCAETGAATYIFRCPTCTMAEVRPAKSDVVEALVSAGVSLTRWSLPAELSECRSGRPISHDDLLAFHEIIHGDEWTSAFGNSWRGRLGLGPPRSCVGPSVDCPGGHGPRSCNFDVWSD